MAAIPAEAAVELTDLPVAPDTISDTKSALESDDAVQLLESGEKMPQREKARLASVEELPGWYKAYAYPFVNTGYRLHYDNPKECLRSVFQLHCETGNIWSHAVGVVAWLVSVGYVSQMISDSEATALAGRDGLTGKLSWSWMILAWTCGTMMPIASAVAHTLYCQSEKAGKLWWQVDFAGVMVLFLARLVYDGYFAAFCVSAEIRITTLGITVVGFTAAAIPLIIRSNKAMCAPLFLATHAPLVWICVQINGDVAGKQHAINGLFWAFTGSLCTAIGFALDALGLPQRLSPGRFDIWGHSHQLWHLLVILAPIFIIRGGVDFAKWRLQSECPA